MNKLMIDTRDNKNVFASIISDGKKYVAKSDNVNKRPDSIVNLISKVLEESDLKKSEIDEIMVEEGPGSYTGLKVGVSVANALSFALGKKINGKEFGNIQDAKYE